MVNNLVLGGQHLYFSWFWGLMVHIVYIKKDKHSVNTLKPISTSDPFDLEKIQWLRRDFQRLDGIDQNLGALPRYRVWCVEGSAQPGHLGRFRFDIFKGTMMISMTNGPTFTLLQTILKK